MKGGAPGPGCLRAIPLRQAEAPPAADATGSARKAPGRGRGAAAKRGPCRTRLSSSMAMRMAETPSGRMYAC